MLYRFDNTAVWHKTIVSNDKQEERTAVKGVEFRCFEQTGKIKGQMTILEGASGNTASVTLQTDDEIVKDMEAGDRVEYGDYTFKVLTVYSIRSAAFKGAKEYLIGLR